MANSRSSRSIQEADARSKARLSVKLELQEVDCLLEPVRYSHFLVDRNFPLPARTCSPVPTLPVLETRMDPQLNSSLPTATATLESLRIQSNSTIRRTCIRKTVFPLPDDSFYFGFPCLTPLNSIEVTNGQLPRKSLTLAFSRPKIAQYYSAISLSN